MVILNLFLPLPLPFLQRPPSNTLMHPFIHPYHPCITYSHRTRKRPLHHRMRPVRRACPGPPLRPSRPAHHSQHPPHKHLRTRNHETRSPDLTHRARDKITLYQLHRHAVGLKLASEGGGPLL